ncbi:MAG: CDP-glycerol glycerophosphotransferase family protein [Chlamydiae bacterium]|nr:CDP-glycerol glycerophosphotransferase family protein [Chlamydiota bacterium]
MNSYPRAVAIITGPDTLLDHIGVLSQELNIPLIVTEQETFDIAKIFYPDLNAKLINLQDLSLAFLVNHFDIIFQSYRFAQMEMSSSFKLLYQKEMRFVYCPHGNSDKGFSLTHHPIQDMALVYGEHMMSSLKTSGAVDNIQEIIVTGNYRLAFYEKHKPFYDSLTDRILKKHLISNLQTILYAPTWEDGENPSSFFSCCDRVIQDLQARWNVIVKIHPLIEQLHPAQTLSITSRYENQPGIIFLSKFPSIYPILELADLYIGDFSSIGYDFLSFDKPLFFFNTVKQLQKNAEGCFLHQCGLSIPEDPSLNLHDFLHANRPVCQEKYKQIRKRIYEFAYGNPRKMEEVKNEIFLKMQGRKV